MVTHYLSVALLILVLSDPSLADHRLYVTSNGLDLNNTNCSADNPCGTLFQANIVRAQIEESMVEILVNGVNQLQFGSKEMYLARVVRTIFTKSTTITFNTTESVDHFYFVLVSNTSSQRLIINNMIYTQTSHTQLPVTTCFNDTYPICNQLNAFNWTCVNVTKTYCYNNSFPSIQYSYYHRILVQHGTLELNGCTFTDLQLTAIDRHDQFISAANVEINNCAFKNISYSMTSYYENTAQKNGFIGLHPSAYTEYSASLSIAETIFQDMLVMDSHLLTVGRGSWIARTNININECIFTNVNIFNNKSDQTPQHLFYFSAFDYITATYGINEINITNSSFNDINSIVLIDSGHMTMENVTINSFDVGLIDVSMIEVHENARLILRNSDVIYHTMDKFIGYCDYGCDYNDSDCAIFGCEYGNQLLVNGGYVEMNNVFITNDLSENGLNEFRDYWLETVPDLFDNDVVFVFDYKIYDDPDAPFDPPSLIYNSGTLLLTDFELFGIGIYPTILNNKEIAIIDNMTVDRPLFVFDNMDLINPKGFISHDLAIIYNQGSNVEVAEINSTMSCSDSVNEYCVLDEIHVNPSGILAIQNSYFDGVGGIVIDSGGYVGIYDTDLYNSVMISIGIGSNKFIISGCNFVDIGGFHLGDAYHLNDFNDYHHLWLTNAQNIIIERNLFESFTEESSYINITGENIQIISVEYNTFINPISIENLNNNTHHFEDVGIDQHTLWSTYKSTDYASLPLVHLQGLIRSRLIGNIFESNDVYTSMKKPCLVIDGPGSSIHCIAGNTFYGNGIRILGATLKSCAHPQLSAHHSECFEALGAFTWDNAENMDYHNTFIATDKNLPIITIGDEAKVVLDQSVIEIEFYNNMTYNPLLIKNNGMVSILDMIMPKSIEITFDSQCVYECPKLFTNNEDQSVTHLHQLHLYCTDIDENDSKSSIIRVSDLVPLKLVKHTLPTEIKLNSSLHVFPGGSLDIISYIVDNYGNIIDNWSIENVSITLYSSDFNLLVTLNIDTQVIEMISDPDPNEYTSTTIQHTQPLYIQNIRADAIGQTYTILINVVDDLLEVNDLNITIIQCPAGYGLNNISSQCQECPIQQFSLSSSNSACLTCDYDNLEGIDCAGGKIINMLRNHWVFINANSSNSSGYISTRHDIVSKHCPANYCNRQTGHYLELRQSDALCAIGRDPAVPLCGKCKDGLSELFGSPNCDKCERHKIEIWIIFVVLSLLFSILMVYLNGVSKPENFNSDKKSKLEKIGISIAAQNFAKIALLKPILYYYQSLAFIFVNTGIIIYFMAIADIFNFQIDFGNGIEDTSGYCWVPNLNAKQEIILNGTIPIFCLFGLMAMGIIYKIKKYSIYGRKPYFGKAFVNLLLLFIGSVSGVCFRLIACRTIADDVPSVHFYFGEELCYNQTWNVSLAVLSVFVFVFFCLFIKLFIDHRNVNKIHLLQSDEYILESLVKSFEIEKYWFWEFIMFSRRLMIAMINVLADNDTAKNVLFVLLMLYLMAHMQCNPFIIPEINALESVCLLCLLSVLYVISNDDGTNDTNAFTIVILNILLLLPLIVFFIQFAVINCSDKQKNEKQNKSKNDGERGEERTGAIRQGSKPSTLSRFGIGGLSGISNLGNFRTTSAELESDSDEKKMIERESGDAIGNLVIELVPKPKPDEDIYETSMGGHKVEIFKPGELSDNLSSFDNAHPKNATMSNQLDSM